MESSGGGAEPWEKPRSVVKARIQQWESGETLSLHRKDLKNRAFRQSLYSDSSLRRPTTRDPRQKQPLLPPHTGVGARGSAADCQRGPGQAGGEGGGGSADFQGRRLRMASTGSVLEASDVLAAALEQMDGIIAGSQFDYSTDCSGSCTDTGNDWWQLAHSSLRGHGQGQGQGQGQSQSVSDLTAARVSRLLGDVKSSLEFLENKEDVKNSLPPDLLGFLRDWVFSQDCFLTASGYLPESVEEKVRKLEAEKQSLALQASVLSEQVEAQSEKIAELEFQVDDRDNRLMQAQDMLQSELLTHTSLETHKLDLMAEISSLKLKLAAAEKDRRELDERCRSAQRQIAELEAKVLIKDAEMAEMRQRLIRNGTVIMPERGETEVEKLKKAVDTLMVSNEDKDRRLEDMRRLLKRYRRVEEILVQAQGRKAVEELLQNVEDDTSSTSSSTTPSIHDTSMRDHFNNDDFNNRHAMSSPSATSTPVHYTDSSRINGTHGSTAAHSLPASARQALGMTRSNSCENIAVTPEKGTADGRKKGSNHNGGSSYGTLPKQGTASYSSTPSRNREGASIERDISANSSSSSAARRSRGFPMLGKTLLRIRSGKRSSSAPNLAHTEVVTDDEDGLQHMGVPGAMHPDHKKRRGLRRLFGKLKRSSSQDFEGGRDHVDTGEFRRGGVRATATARLAGWSQRTKLMDTDVPFSRWDGDRVTAWMNEIGLNMYLGECKRWVRNGEQLLKASVHDLEKELGIKNMLHRKKLQLALQAMGGEKSAQLCDLDHNFVARWLDDIGLPQYKDMFYDARVDGRMLHYLTVDDLLALKVTNELHHISIKRGIQILRLNGFNPGCLRRRPFPEELNQPVQNQPGEIMLWTNHRVMEWLRTIDLSEYAPNLRGSGVHGALLVLEPRFNAELFALLLSIPPNKTLLRRHLSTHFVGIIGIETQTRKRDFESSPGYQPILVNAKVKRGKFGLFGHKRSKSDVEADTLICPFEGAKNGSQGDGKAAQEIGAVSKEINSLTSMLSQERFMDSAKTSNV